MLIDLLGGSLPGHDVLLPGSDRPVRLSRLDEATSLVRFPTGWRRTRPGHYLAGEELLVLAGSLEISGITYTPGDHAWLPSGTLQHSSTTPPNLPDPHPPAPPSLSESIPSPAGIGWGWSWE
ncbi:hypothetical protein ACIBHX_44765 [Nonomuraea sp. NPDC050536]|uniref:hypothetical protein n=1 Tax=Nonomuraea sp. NPDC050536 TaxID=3364366 RepID=UPI0037C57341